MVKHVIPNTLEEVLRLLNEDHYEIISGGTDLMVQRRKWADTPPEFKNTINIFNINELNYIRKHEDHLHIGATTPMSDILVSELTPKLLKDAIYEIAHSLEANHWRGNTRLQMVVNDIRPDNSGHQF